MDDLAGTNTSSMGIPSYYFDGDVAANASQYGSPDSVAAEEAISNQHAFVMGALVLVGMMFMLGSLSFAVRMAVDERRRIAEQPESPRVETLEEFQSRCIEIKEKLTTRRIIAIAMVGGEKPSPLTIHDHISPADFHVSSSSSMSSLSCGEIFIHLSYPIVNDSNGGQKDDDIEVGVIDSQHLTGNMQLFQDQEKGTDSIATADIFGSNRSAEEVEDELEQARSMSGDLNSSTIHYSRESKKQRDCLNLVDVGTSNVSPEWNSSLEAQEESADAKNGLSSKYLDEQAHMNQTDVDTSSNSADLVLSIKEGGMSKDEESGLCSKRLEEQERLNLGDTRTPSNPTKLELAIEDEAITSAKSSLSIEEQGKVGGEANDLFSKPLKESYERKPLDIDTLNRPTRSTDEENDFSSTDNGYNHEKSIHQGKHPDNCSVESLESGDEIFISNQSGVSPMSNNESPTKKQEVLDEVEIQRSVDDNICQPNNVQLNHQNMEIAQVRSSLHSSGSGVSPLQLSAIPAVDLAMLNNNHSKSSNLEQNPASIKIHGGHILCGTIPSLEEIRIQSKKYTPVEIHQQEAAQRNISQAATCATCLMDYQVGDEVCFSSNQDCIHVFHKDCIVEWLARTPQCPCCKRHYLERDPDNHTEQGSE